MVDVAERHGNGLGPALRAPKPSVVAEMAAEYRAQLRLRFAERLPGPGGHRDLQLLADELTAELGPGPQLPPPSPKDRKASDYLAVDSTNSDASPSPSSRTRTPGGSPAAASSPGGLSSGALSGAPGPEDAVVIFDWDDTLFPTWFLQEAVLPTLANSNPREAVLPRDSAFYETLAAHAGAVRAVLTVARAVARVAIVTLAMRPWVLTSSDRFLPGLDLSELLSRLEIPVYYAREHVKRPDACLAQVEEGVDVFTVAKRATMLKCLRKLYGRRCARMNVLSVGDSAAEKDAIKEVIWAACENDAALCKTVKFIYQPTLQQLGDQLQLLVMWIRRMAWHGEDFDLSMDDPDDLRLRGHELFS